MLFFTKVGRYTEEAFETAFGPFQATRRPFLFTYFKSAPNTAPRADLQTLWAFQDKLQTLGHFQTEYRNAAELKMHFSEQLDKLAANGFIEFTPASDTTDTTAAVAGSGQQATLTGDGAIAQALGATALGAGSVHVGGNTGTINTRTINAGTQIGGDLVLATKVAATGSASRSIPAATISVATSLPVVAISPAVTRRSPRQSRRANWKRCSRRCWRCLRKPPHRPGRREAAQQVQELQGRSRQGPASRRQPHRPPDRRPGGDGTRRRRLGSQHLRHTDSRRHRRPGHEICSRPPERQLNCKRPLPAKGATMTRPDSPPQAAGRCNRREREGCRPGLRGAGCS
ncbi:MAG: hypothetical protein IPN78_18420 [Candidatus Accumulibacter sp.]|nr:hypothetical protein [Candidatus Accumulibacter propinquus]